MIFLENEAFGFVIKHMKLAIHGKLQVRSPYFFSVFSLDISFGPQSGYTMPIDFFKLKSVVVSTKAGLIANAYTMFQRKQKKFLS